MNTNTRLCTHYLDLNFSEGFFDCPSSEDFTQDFREINNISMGDPYPIHKPLRGCTTDKVLKYQEDVCKYEEKLSTLSHDFNIGNYYSNIVNQNFQDTHIAITRNMLEFCQDSSMVKIPYVCDYNPFYASGLLESFTLNEENCLIRPDIKNNLRVTIPSNPTKVFKLSLKRSFESPILGISSTAINSESVVLLAIRLKNMVHVIKLKDLKSSVPTVWRRNFQNSVLCADIDHYQVSVVTSDLKLHLFDIKSNKELDLGEFDIQSSLKSAFIDTNLLGVLSKTSLNLLDLRSSDYKLFKPTLIDCDDFCSFKIVGDVVYVCTRHHLLRTDIRFINNQEFCSHMMKNSPCFLESGPNFVCLANQTGDKIIFCGSEANSLPLKVPRINETHQKCELERDILLKSDSLLPRFNLSTVGIKILGDSLYSANFVGDIFKQNSSLNPSHEDPVQKLYEWIGMLPKQRDYLHITNLVNASDVRFTLTKTSYEKLTIPTSKTDKFLSKYKLDHTKGNVKDVAANFLEQWIDEDEEGSEISLVPEVPTHEKVTSWIQSSSFH